MTKIIVAGANGRMGQAILRRAESLPELSVAGQVERGDDLRAMIDSADVVIDFTFHDATVGFARLCAAHHKAIVIGATGHSGAERAELKELSARVPMVWAANFSTGITLLLWLTQKAAEILGPEYDLEIVEMHHRLKKDAPSGTARALAEVLAGVRQQQLERVLRHGREGLVGERAAAEIGMHSIRGGDVVGDHTVILATNGERVELTHKASSRDTFAAGALRAAQWIMGRAPGLYGMKDVLELK